VTGYPTLLTFSGEVKGDYDGERELEDLVAFVNEKAATDRTVEGTLGNKAGLIDVFQQISDEFLAKVDIDTIIGHAKELAKNVDKEDTASADFYVRALERIKSKPEFLETEIARLTKLISGTSVSAVKKDEFSKRLNILVSFTSQPDEPEEVDPQDLSQLAGEFDEQVVDAREL